MRLLHDSFGGGVGCTELRLRGIHASYIDMTNPDYAMVACGFYEAGEGEVWSVQNFQ